VPAPITPAENCTSAASSRRHTSASTSRRRANGSGDRRWPLQSSKSNTTYRSGHQRRAWRIRHGSVKPCRRNRRGKSGGPSASNATNSPSTSVPARKRRKTSSSCSSSSERRKLSEQDHRPVAGLVISEQKDLALFLRALQVNFIASSVVDPIAALKAILKLASRAILRRHIVIVSPMGTGDSLTTSATWLPIVSSGQSLGRFLPGSHAVSVHNTCRSGFARQQRLPASPLGQGQVACQSFAVYERCYRAWQAPERLHAESRNSRLAGNGPVSHRSARPYGPQALPVLHVAYRLSSARRRVPDHSCTQTLRRRATT
jgi:hypothetical protein